MIFPAISCTFLMLYCASLEIRSYIQSFSVNTDFRQYDLHWNEYYRYIGYSFNADGYKINVYNGKYTQVRLKDYVGNKIFVECFGYNKDFDK